MADLERWKRVPTLVGAVARELGIDAPLSEPRHETREEPSSQPGWTRSLTTTRWSAGGLTAALIVGGEGPEHEGGGARESLVLTFPCGAVVALGAGLSRYSIMRAGDAAAVERVLLHALASLGWSSTPWLPWAGGRVSLDPHRPRVVFESDHAAWEVEVPASRGILVFLESSVEVQSGMLFVWTSCEHGNAGGGPFLFRLHRVLEHGAVAWTRTLDLIPRPHQLRVVDGALEVFAAWTTRLDQTDVPARWSRLDPDTGEG